MDIPLPAENKHIMETSDRPNYPAIDITPEMIMAGKRAYAEDFLNLISGEEDAPESLVRRVFLDMLRAAPPELFRHL